MAPLPEEVNGHFGANLVRYLLSQHFQCRVTMPLLRQQLGDFGMLISAGQISNLLCRATIKVRTPDNQDEKDVPPLTAPGGRSPTGGARGGKFA